MRLQYIFSLSECSKSLKGGCRMTNMRSHHKVKYNNNQ